ncbi:hypothetical protein FHG87_023169, partial [Trinorchestia longiramus]
VGNRSHSISGSTQQLHSCRGSNQNLLGGDNRSYHITPTINIADTSITVTNTDDDSNSNSNSRNNSMTDLCGP